MIDITRTHDIEALLSHHHGIKAIRNEMHVAM